MDPRTSTSLPIRAASRGLRWLNQRHPWSHNDHFHGWILRNLPVARGRALDVGCGRGALVERLRTRFDEVVGVDPDPTMAGLAAERFASDHRVCIRQAEFAETSGTFDLITMVASLHHQETEHALRHASDLLAPGGRLLVIGLARLETPSDLAIDLVSIVLNPVVGLVKHPRPVRRTSAGAMRDEDPMPVRSPVESTREIVTAADRVIPGARLRRRLFFRYTLAWERPG